MTKAVLLALAATTAAASATVSRPAAWTSCGNSADFSPAWSPNGRTVAFTHTSSNGAVSQVFRIGRDGRGLRRVSSTPTEFAYDPVWSPDGASIAYTTFDNGAVARIVVARPDGSAARVVASFQAERNPPAAFVTWSPDGARLAYVDFAGDLIAGGRVVAHGATQPAWSPAGDKIAYVVSTGIVVANVDGSDPRRLADGAYPRWSPDGRRLAYTSRSGVGVHVIAADRSGDRLVDASGTSPSWFEDGRRLVDTAEPTRRRRGAVHVVDLAHGSVVTVSHDGSARFGGDDFAASVHGRDILFTSVPAVGGYDGELRLVRADGRGERRLTYHCVIPDESRGGHVYGTWLDDVILARNGLGDTIVCGPGRDRVVADRRDRVTPGCEVVRR